MPPRVALVVDDNDDDQALTVRAIRKADPECSVVVARDGVAALEVLGLDDEDRGQGLSPEFVLLDIKMPRLSGLEVLQRIRQHPRTRNLAVVIFSSSDDDGDVRAASQLGAVYERKPVDFRHYQDVVQAIVRKRWSANGTFFD